MKRSLLIVLFALYPLVAFGQASPSGGFTPGHPLTALTPSGSPYADGGGPAGSSIFGSGYLTGLGITNTGTPFCINDSLISGPYHQLCLGANALGTGLLSYNAYNGASPLGLSININGTNIDVASALGGMKTDASNAVLPDTLKSLGKYNQLLSVDDAPFSAKGDYTLLADGVASGTAFSSASATFTAADVGKYIFVWGGGTTAPIAPPPAPSLVATVQHGAQAGRTEYIKTTYVGSGGETLASVESSIAVGANNVIQVLSPPPLYGAVGWNVYVSTSAGTETQQNAAPLTISAPWVEPDLGLTAGAALPVSNTTSATPPLFTTIAGFVDAHHATLAAPSAAVSNAPFGYGTDNTAAINNALATCGATGGRLRLGAHQYLVAGGNVTIPTGCTLGSDWIVPNQTFAPSIGSHNVPAIVLSPGYSVFMQASAGVSGLACFQYGLPGTITTTRMGVDAFSSFNGTCLDAATASNPSIDNFFGIGFNNLVVTTSSQRAFLGRIYGDSRIAISFTHSHDVNVIQAVHLWPFLTANSFWATTVYNISAVAASGANIAVTIPSSNVLKTGDTVVIGDAGEFTGANNKWTVASVSGGTVILAGSQASPAITATWNAGSYAMQVVSTNSLGIGQTLAATGIGPGDTNTINNIDLLQNIVTMNSPATGSGSAASVTATNTAYTVPDGTLTLRSEYPAVGLYVASTQGVHLGSFFSFGYQIGVSVDQTTTTDGVGDIVLGDAGCDGPYDPTSICMQATAEQATLPAGFSWRSGFVSAGVGTALYVDAGPSATTTSSPSTIVNGVGFFGNPQTSAPISLRTGNVIISSSPMGGGGGGAVTVRSGVAKLTLSGDPWDITHLAILGTGQANIAIDGATKLSPLSLGTHLVQVFSASGTFFKPNSLKQALVRTCAGGGGGGSGALTASGTNSSGGAGGAGGGCSDARLATADITSPVTVTVGLGGAGGTAISASDTVGKPGLGGGNSSFGTYTRATGGGAGAGGQSNANSGGGGAGAGCSNMGVSSCNAGVDGSGVTAGVSTASNAGLGGLGNGGSGAIGGSSVNQFLGAGGGGGVNGAAGANGGPSLHPTGAAGGGAGGGVTAGPLSTNGGNGGRNISSGSGSAAAIEGAGGTVGTPAGGSSTPGYSYVAGSGGGGGYGNAAGNGGGGGAGVQGSGGGGGGSALDGSISGAGAKGGDGLVAVFMTF